MISVIIPAYHAGAFIKRALDSVEDQNYDNIEVIVVLEDRGYDNTMDIIQDHALFKDDRLLLLHRDGKSNPAHARNIGVEHSKGSYIAFLDADDEWIRNTLYIKKRILDSWDVDLVYGRARWIYPSGHTAMHGHYIRRLPYSNPVPFSTVVVRRDKFIPFDERLNASDDYKWLLDLKDNGCRFRCINNILSNIYIHENNLSAGKVMEMSKQAWAVHKLRGEYGLGAFKYLMNIPLSLIQRR